MVTGATGAAADAGGSHLDSGADWEAIEVEKHGRLLHVPTTPWPCAWHVTSARGEGRVAARSRSDRAPGHYCKPFERARRQPQMQCQKISETDERPDYG